MQRSKLQFKNKTQSGGFTLVELLLYTAIMGILAFSISAFMTYILESRVKNQVIAEVEQQGAQVVEMIAQTARNATSITSPTAGNNAASLTLVVPTASVSPTVFSLSGSAIQMTEGAGSAVALTNSKITASGLSFYNLSRPSTAGTFRFFFTLTHVNPQNKNEYNYSKLFTATATIRP